MKKAFDPIAAGITDAAGHILPKYFCGFDGVSMKTLNPPETIKNLKPEGSKGF